MESPAEHMIALHQLIAIEGAINEITFSCDRRRYYVRNNSAVSGAGLVLFGTRHNGCFGLGQISQLRQCQDYCVARMRGAQSALRDVLHHVLHLTNAFYLLQQHAEMKRATEAAPNSKTDHAAASRSSASSASSVFLLLWVRSWRRPHTVLSGQGGLPRNLGSVPSSDLNALQVAVA
jgi:hypothetical protein